jgi:transcriptional regulator with XRE-family HTH domain
VDEIILITINNHIKLKKAKIKAIAEHLNLSRQQLSRLLSGKSEMTVKQLAGICDYLGLKIIFHL